MELVCSPPILSCPVSPSEAMTTGVRSIALIDTGARAAMLETEGAATSSRTAQSRNIREKLPAKTLTNSDN